MKWNEALACLATQIQCVCKFQLTFPNRRNRRALQCFTFTRGKLWTEFEKNLEYTVTPQIYLKTLILFHLKSHQHFCLWLSNHLILKFYLFSLDNVILFIFSHALIIIPSIFIALYGCSYTRCGCNYHSKEQVRLLLDLVFSIEYFSSISSWAIHSHKTIKTPQH